MSKNKYHILFFIFFCFLSVGFIFFSMPAGKVFALQLNVDYPQTPAGSSITPQSTVPEYLKYVFDFGMFAGFIALFISLAIAGVYYFLSPAIPSAQALAKDRVYGSFSGMLILLLVYLIITAINPNLIFFQIGPLSSTQVQPLQTPQKAGVYLFEKNGCPGQPDPLIQISSAYDIKNLKGRVASAKIIQDQQGGVPYVGILFEKSNFEGKCFYIDPNGSCQGINPPFGTSISVYQYNRYPAAGSVTFYREPFYNTQGGSLQVAGSQISGIYVKSLDGLNYMNSQSGNPNDPNNCTVPKEKMDCIKWDNTGVCTQRKCPDLSGENIGSIKITGNYVVMLVYFSPDDKSKGPWSYCQSFPAPDDKIKMGPNKIKWEDVKNQNRLPNYVLILPVLDNTNPDVNKNP